MGERLLEVSLFGACVVRSIGRTYEITGAKHKAMVALLVTAPVGRRTRAFLQETLWGTSCYDSGRQSLRRALSDIKTIMGDDFAHVFHVSNAEIAVDLSTIHFIGRPGGGEFLEGIDIRDTQFNAWLGAIRVNPAQVHSLFSATLQPPPPSMLPVIAILPFRAMAEGARYTVLGDWLAEEICRSLSRSNLLSVISHLSARALVTSSYDVARIRNELGADYCLTGGMRIMGDQVILDCDQIDVATGRILWTRQFTGKISEFLLAEARPVVEIVRTVGRSLASEALSHARGRSVSDLDDHSLLIAGVSLMHAPTLSGFARSRELLEEVIRRAPRAAEGHAWLGEWYVMSITNGWTTDVPRDTSTALDCTARALDIDPTNAFCLTIDGVVHNNLLMQFDTAELRFDAALDHNPNESMSWLLSGVLHAYRDEDTTAIERVERAMRLSPLDPLGYFYEALAASAYLSGENYGRALELADRSMARNDRHLSTLRARICALYHLGREDEAREAGKALIGRQPDFTVANYLKSHPASQFKLGKRVAVALEAAGIP